jgi:hypothetical protein
MKAIKTNHENTKFRKHEILFYISFFVFLTFRALVIGDFAYVEQIQTRP